MKRTALTLAFLVGWMFTVPMGMAQKSDDAEHGELAKALRSAKISLQRGLTAKGDKFSEVIVDHKTGKVGKAEPITGGEDLTAAKAQGEAMVKAKRSLDAAASEAANENKGYRVVSVMPALKDGHPVADVTLVKGTEWKSVTEKLDWTGTSPFAV